jgi:hypothetical protein
MTPPDQDYCTIPLTQGQQAIVDVADYPVLSQFKWQATKIAKGRGGFYARRKEPTVDGKQGSYIYMHRQILGLEKGDRRKSDHREPSATLDNRRSNLRIASSFQNVCNTRRAKNNTTGIKGVRYRKGNYEAQIHVGGKCLHLISSKRKEVAGAAYAEAARKHFGEYGRTE